MSVMHNLKMKFKRPKQVARLEIIDEKCVRCGNCIRMCKKEVFAMSGSQVVVADFAACVGCGKCVKKMCNFGAIDLVLAEK